MLAKIRDGTRNVLNMQHIIPNSKRWDYSDIPGGDRLKDPPTWLKVATTLEKPPTPTDFLSWNEGQMTLKVKLNNPYFQHQLK